MSKVKINRDKGEKQMNLRNFLRISLFLTLCLALAIVLPSALGKAQEKPPFPEEFKAKVKYLSGVPMFIAAQEFGITEIMGKDITLRGSPPGKAKAKKLKDVGVGVHPVNHENEPTVVANPKDKKKLVAGSHSGDPFVGIYYCVAYYSHDGGATWSSPIFMPGLSPGSRFADPVMAYTPDGSRVYFAYMDIKAYWSGLLYISVWDIVFSYSDDDGVTWTGPIVALAGLPSIYDSTVGDWIQLGFDYDKCWIGTHIDASQSNWVYVTATRFDNFFPYASNIAFTRSGDKGVSWSAPTILDTGTFGVVVQGSRPTGGMGSDVVVAWYHSGNDGWLTGNFEIRTAYSPNNGATFGAPVTAVIDNYECPYYLGPGGFTPLGPLPFNFYHRWWGSMFPDVEIDPGGKAHIVYTHDPDPSLFMGWPGVSANAEDGDIRYITSSGPPYGPGSWFAPVTINDDGLVRAQGYPALKTQHGGKSSTLHVIWEDHRTSPSLPIAFPNSPNLYFDMFYSRNVPGKGVGWFSNFRISEQSSINDYSFIGDYNDLAANKTTLFGIWTDRRHQNSIFQYEDNVYGSRIIAGGGLGK